MAAANTSNTGIVFDFHIRGTPASYKLVVVAIKQCRMRFPRRVKVCIRAPMNLQAAPREPASDALAQLRRLWNFRHSQEVAIEGRTGSSSPAGMASWTWSMRRNGAGMEYELEVGGLGLG
jgi:hypothetical protein